MITQFVVTVTDPHISTAALAKWLREVAAKEVDTMPKALSLARRMIFGESWHPSADHYFNPHGCPILEGITVTTTQVKTEFDIQHEARQKEIQRQLDLLHRAVGGDADAAIEYCQLIADGKTLNYSAYA